MSFDSVFPKKRQVIPRWFTYPTARWLGLLENPANPNIQLNSISFEKAKLDWVINRKLFHATDAVGSAILENRFNDKDIEEAAKFVLENKHSSQLANNMAKDYLFYFNGNKDPIPENILPQNDRAYWNVISRVRSELVQYPRNYIKWAELSYFYSTLGQFDKAERAMEVAISGNSDNRFILLSAARFFLHNGLHDKALYYLRKSISKNIDPWVISAEIAITDSFGLASKSYKLGTRLLENNKVSDFHKSELAGAIGTMEVKSGQIKSARKLIRSALINPTENTIAQAVFLLPELGALNLDQSLLNSKVSFEAETQLRFKSGSYMESFDSAKSWLKFQPFSSRPAIIGSYIASVTLNKYEEAINITKFGLLSSPNDLMLMNNQAFSLISLKRLSEAQVLLERAIPQATNPAIKATLQATQGAFEFKSGRPEVGRQLYKKAIDEFTIQKDDGAKTLATYFWHREESELEHKQESWLLQLNSDLNELLKKTGLKEIQILFDKKVSK